MRGYDNDRDDYDDYYEKDECQEYEEKGEAEYEEDEKEEPRKPRKEELEYLELRQKLKEPFRKQMKKENIGSGSSISRADSTNHRKRNKLPYDNYGSFFGPSQPVIAPRVIQESKSLLESPHLASRTSNPHHIQNHNKASNGGSKSISHNPPRKVSKVKVKAQKIKDTRDYSFLLSDDAELPAPSNATATHNVSVRNSEGRPAHVPGRTKQPLSNGDKLVHGRHEERKLVSGASHLPTKSGSHYNGHHEERKVGSVANHLPPKSGSNYKGRHEERKLGSVANHLPPKSGSNYNSRHEEWKLGSVANHLPPKSGSNYNSRHEERKPGSTSSHLPPKSGSHYNGHHEERKAGSVANHLPPKSGSNYNGRSEERKPSSVANHLPSKSGSNYNGRHEEQKLGSVASQLPPRSGSNYNGHHEERKLGYVADPVPPKSGSSYKSSSTSKPSMASADSRKQLGNYSGNGPGRPLGPKVPSKMSIGTTGNKSSTPGIRNPRNGVQRSVPSKVHSFVPRQSVEQRKDIRDPYNPKMIPKQPVESSKPQINKPAKKNSMITALQEHRPKKKAVRRHPDDAEDEMDISSMIRSMFNYNPNKFADEDDDDNMEAGFDEILREERRSAIIAKREDEEQLRLIEEEEERERRRRLAKSKKRRLE